MVKEQIDSSLVVARAEKAFETKMRKFNKGKIKTKPTLESCLKWSRKIDAEYKKEQEALALKPFRPWFPPKKDYTDEYIFGRFYFDDDRYIQVRIKDISMTDEYRHKVHVQEIEAAHLLIFYTHHNTGESELDILKKEYDYEAEFIPSKV